MSEIVGACLSQSHDDENSFELLVEFADGREVGYFVTRSTAQKIAAEFDAPSPLVPNVPVCTGCKDKDGNLLFLGDRVRYLLAGKHTKEEYWNPEYEIVWEAPTFTLKHIGGGKDGGSHDWILRTGFVNKSLVLLSRGDRRPEAQKSSTSPSTHDMGVVSHV